MHAISIDRLNSNIDTIIRNNGPNVYWLEKKSDIQAIFHLGQSTTNGEYNGLFQSEFSIWIVWRYWKTLLGIGEQQHRYTRNFLPAQIFINLYYVLALFSNISINFKALIHFCTYTYRVFSGFVQVHLFLWTGRLIAYYKTRRTHRTKKK